MRMENYCIYIILVETSLQNRGQLAIEIILRSNKKYFGFFVDIKSSYEHV